MIALMGTILVPLFAHYRSPKPAIQAAPAGGCSSPVIAHRNGHRPAKQLNLMAR
jgi:hypothetical protein